MKYCKAGCKAAVINVDYTKTSTYFLFSVIYKMGIDHGYENKYISLENPSRKCYSKVIYCIILVFGKANRYL